jgi:hypothetical protein
MMPIVVIREPVNLAQGKGNEKLPFDADFN